MPSIRSGFSNTHLHPLRITHRFEGQCQQRLPRGYRQGCDLTQHLGKQPPRGMTLGQQEPVAARMLYQPSAGLNQVQLQSGQRPVADP